MKRYSNKSVTFIYAQRRYKLKYIAVKFFPFLVQESPSVSYKHAHHSGNCGGKRRRFRSGI